MEGVGGGVTGLRGDSPTVLLYHDSSVLLTSLRFLSYFFTMNPPRRIMARVLILSFPPQILCE